MAVKKSELYSKIWESCDNLRGGMDASQYKDYVLVMLFVKYISDKYANQPYALITVPKGSTFKDMVALKGKNTIGDDINKKIIGPIAEKNRLSNMPDFNDADKLGKGKEMVDRLSSLIAIFEDKALDFSKNRADGDDLLGDAYEYLMRHFATESGKSKGQFYTPAEVSRVIAKTIGITKENSTNETTANDPTCGSGSLLLKVAYQAERAITLYGQEKDSATSGLAKMNMILHECSTAEIRQGNTLANPRLDNDGSMSKFDYVVANPPFSDKRWGHGVNTANDEYGRFIYGIPPSKNGDYAYLLHILSSLKSRGKGACILPHGVLFRGNVEGEIRTELVQRGFIKGIIGLPPNMFYGTGIPACIILLDKENASSRKGIFIIDASKSFKKDGNKNRLREQDIHKIVDAFNKRLEIPKYSRMVPTSEIQENEFNLNIPRYIDSSEPEDIQDIEGHLQGGIPKADVDSLERFWNTFPTMRSDLFTGNGRDGYFELKVPKEEVKKTILEHAEFKTYSDEMNQIFNEWKTDTVTFLKGLNKGHNPKEVIYNISEDLLHRYAKRDLVDKYDVYQHLMDYWNETMQDDCYIISGDGWKAETTRIIEEKKNGKKQDKGWTCDLVPKELVINRYFPDEKEEIEKQVAEMESLNSQKEELEEEHNTDGGALQGIGTKAENKILWDEAFFSAWEELFPFDYVDYQAAGKKQKAESEKLEELKRKSVIKDCMNNKGNITKASINQKMKTASEEDKKILQSYNASDDAIKKAKIKAKELLSKGKQEINTMLLSDDDSSALNDLRILNQYINTLEEISTVKKSIKEAETELDNKLYALYPLLSEEEVKILVVDDKWMKRMEKEVNTELERVSHRLAGRIKELAERYETPLFRHTEMVEALEERVKGHLERMGYQWK